MGHAEALQDPSGATLTAIVWAVILASIGSANHGAREPQPPQQHSLGLRPPSESYIRAQCSDRQAYSFRQCTTSAENVCQMATR